MAVNENLQQGVSLMLRLFNCPLFYIALIIIYTPLLGDCGDKMVLLTDEILESPSRSRMVMPISIF